nr:hypothetical protein [Anoxybacillus sp. ST4]
MKEMKAWYMNGFFALFLIITLLAGAMWRFFMEMELILPLFLAFFAFLFNDRHDYGAT